MVDLGGDVRALLAQAQRAAQRLNEQPTTGHIVLAMLESRDDTGRLLESHGARAVSLYEILKDVEAEATNMVELALERARRIAAQSGARKARPLHLLLAALQNARSEAHRGLSALGVPVEALRQMLEDSLGMPQKTRTQSAQTPVMAEAKPLPRTLIDWEAQKRNQIGPSPMARGPVPTKPARLPPANDVRPEPAPEALTLARVAPPQRPMKTRSVGALQLDPGAFPLLSSLGRNLSLDAAEGRIDAVIGRDKEIEQVLDVLARRRANNPILVGPPGVGKTAIVEGLALQLYAEMGDARVVVEVSAGSLVSGTGVRGALSEKIAKLRKEVKASEGRVLLFIDEIHALISSGDGPDDLATELKAALARGELPCVGATTEAEYRRVFERDVALSRRFTRIEVGEPSRDAALAIVRSAALHYERFHSVAYARDALEAAVDLSVRYLPEQHLPDKAIGLLDRAAARARRRGAEAVDRAAVAQVVSEQAGVPLDRLLMRDKERLLALEETLGARVIGQRQAIARVGDAIRKGAVGLRGKRPLGVFLFLGPTGVGKTELAKALSDELFATSGMTRLDMSEYSESHAVARLFGAPPGYLGHEDGGQLTEAVRKKPYQLVLLDEIEKAHPDVLLSLLPLFDEGRLTDGRGRTVDFTNTVIVLTSNLCVAEVSRAKSIGFGGANAGSERDGLGERTLAAVRAALPPEVFNRLDEVIYFPRLSREDVGQIARRMLTGVSDTLLREQGIILEFDDSVTDALIAAGGYDPELGARPLRRTVGREIESQLAAAVLRGELNRGDRVRLAGVGDRVQLEPATRGRG
jgi:ATP-dependent Clp protease ATP-binding subunit ClpC